MVTDREGETASTTPRIVTVLFPSRAGAVCREEAGGVLGVPLAFGFVTTHPLPSVFKEPLGRTTASLFGWPGSDGTVTCCSVAAGGSAGAAEAGVARAKTTEPKSAKVAASAVLTRRS